MIFNYVSSELRHLFNFKTKIFQVPNSPNIKLISIIGLLTSL